MPEQLTLTTVPKRWQLDERTREAGRRGIASARAALAAHRPADETRPGPRSADRPAGRPERRPHAA